MKKLYVKIVAGFRKDQQYTIPAEEAHKAYYLFLNPDQRGIFSNGVAVRGEDIKTPCIVPDYHTTLGMNEAHTLDAYDMRDIRRIGLDEKLRKLIFEAKQVALEGNPKLNALPLSQAKSRIKKLES